MRSQWLRPAAFGLPDRAGLERLRRDVTKRGHQFHDNDLKLDPGGHEPGASEDVALVPHHHDCGRLGIPAYYYISSVEGQTSFSCP